MKGISFNGDYVASKGSTSSDGTSMFSIGGLVAFQTRRHCSPDGRQSSDGCKLMTSNYFLQEEIVLEAFDRTELDRYGSGSKNIQEVIDLEDVFCHENYGSGWSHYFLCGIFEDANPRLGTGEGARIEEVRNHAGQFLHVYKIGDEQWLAIEKATSFEEALTLLKLREEKIAQEIAERIEKKFRGVELPFSISTSYGGRYEPSASWETIGIGRAPENDGFRTDLSVMKITECVPDGTYQFYIGGTPVSLTLGEGQPCLSVCTSSSWSNSQNWWYEEHRSTNIQAGWIYINGVDVYEATMKTVAEKVVADKKARNEKFEVVMTSALEAGISDAGIAKILQVAEKGKKIVTLTHVTEMVKKSFALETVLEALQSMKGENLFVVESYLAISKSGVSISRLKKSLKGYAWAYLLKALPEVAFKGNFDDAHKAIELYVKRNPAMEKKSVVTGHPNVWATDSCPEHGTLGNYAWKKFEKLRKQFGE